MEIVVRRTMRRLPQRDDLVAFNNNIPKSSRKVSEVPLDT